MNTLVKLLIVIGFLFVQFTVSAQNLHTRQAPLPCLNKEFTIVAHIARDTFGELNITEAEIQTSIDELNQAFEPICVSFSICEFRTIDNFQYDTIKGNHWEEMQIKFHQENRINMFFVTTIQDGDDFGGFAGMGAIATLDSDGLVILKNRVRPGDKAIRHQMGHYFGLLHTSEGNGAELVNGDNCETAGDLICDTPADPNGQVDVGQGCRFVSSEMDANGEFYRPDVGNYMSLYADECACGYTHGQYLRMAETYLSSSPRMW